MAAKPSIIFVFGPPASGKGTMCKRLAADHALYHLSAGDYLRELVKGPLAARSDIVNSVRAGGTQGLVSGDTIASLLLEKLRDEMKKGESIFLLDGFPRNLEQQASFVSMMKDVFHSETPDLTISIRSPREVAKARYLARKRVDDSPALFEKRYSDYESRDCQVVDLYRDSLVEIEAGVEQTIDQSYAAMLERLSQSQAWRKLVAKVDDDGAGEEAREPRRTSKEG